MTSKTDAQLIQEAKEDIKRWTENWSIDALFTSAQSNFDESQPALDVSVSSRHGTRALNFRVEVIKQRPSGRAPHIEFGEDNWEELDEETFWRWIAISAIWELGK